MPPPIGKVVHVTLSGGTPVAGEFVKVTNFTSGGTIRGAVDKNGEVALNSAASGVTWNLGDSIQIEVTGRLQGVAAATLAAGATKVTVTSTADTTTPAVNI